MYEVSMMCSLIWTNLCCPISRSKIDKLSILGVRSFDNTRSETIQFHTPLTLIVGYNGSGKTTIIECLKYATTGDLPPNSKGGAFIHDPKLCGEKEVLAQVKLSFKGTSGAKMVATRSLQLTVKKATRQQKTLEGQLLMVKDGERTAISSRVAELDQIMPQYLGVSKAILDSVIFCHQDESLWPMSEPSVLKKKFDEIFEALKYTKAIDNIKILRKKKTEELGKYRLLEQQYKIDKDRADRAERQSQKLADEIAALRAECQDLKHEIDKATREANRLWSEAAVYEKIIGTLDGKRIEAKVVEKSIKDLADNIKQMTESDEWLNSTLENYEKRMAELQSLVDQQRALYDTSQSRIEKHRQQLGLKLTEVGKCEAEKSHYDRQLARRKGLIKETARRHGIRGFDTEIDDDLIQEFMARIGKMARDQKQALERAREETREALRESQSTLNLLNERRSALNQSKDFAKQEIASNDKKAAEFQTELDGVDIDEGGIATMQAAVEAVDAKLGSAKQEYDAASWDQKIQEANDQLRTYEDSSNKLNTEMVENTRKAGDLANLRFVKKELGDRKRGLDTMVAAHGDKIAAVVGPEWQPATVERDFSSVLDLRKAEVTDAERQRDGVNRELEQVEFKLSTNRESLKRKRQTQRECGKVVQEAIGEQPEDYPEVVSQLETSRDIRKGDVDGFTNLRNYYSGCIKTASDNNACRLCVRPFRSNKEQSEFITKLEKLMTQVGQQLVVDELKGLEEELAKAREVGPSYDTCQRLSKIEIPELEAETKKLESRREELLAEIEDQDKLVIERESNKKDVEALAKTVQNISRYHVEIGNFGTQIGELSALHGEAGGSRTLEDIQEQLGSMNEQTRAQKKTLSRLTAEKERGRGLINALELETRDVKSRLANASYHLEKKGALVARVEEFRSMNQKQREAIQQAEKEMGQLTPQFAKAQTKHDDINSRGAAKERELQQEATRLSDSVYQLKSAEQEINSYIDKGGPEQLASCQHSVRSIEQEVSSVEEEQKGLTVAINKMTKQMDENDRTKRTIADNIRYRRSLTELESVNAEIAELEAKNAEVDRERFVKEADKMSVRHRKLSAEEASKIGAMKSKDNELTRLLNDWQTDYKDAARNFKESHIKVETTKAAVEDLGRYGSALDKAIMKYHSLKMEEINRIVEELWKRTYQGTDVDTILIRSDNETGKGNRSYNYRVCMVKQDAEMDMRGRCSAGQKVLASILIRLALAECFGTNCGLIALDEPTTNLDRDNIRSLAESLHDIIKARQQQANFQLIVITHDEDFLRYMKCADFCDTYYRVSRNDRQKSIIERQSIAEVTSF
ncbi:MAG: DNA repair protein rad50 [Thelocarpon impressellum]|nr:MAG: DNA repair protein rad50 [Thelocarpon impressellum]